MPKYRSKRPKKRRFYGNRYTSKLATDKVVNMEKEKAKIIIDTDCGIDDAMALMLALNHKDIAQVVAVTCVFGNTTLENVCKNVMRVLVLCDSAEIPIYKGCSKPLFMQTNPKTVHGRDGLGNRGHEFSTGDLKEDEIPAAIALLQLVKKHPKEITLIAIGPLTNVALAHRIDPKFTENLKSLVCMGGNYKGVGNTTEVAEFNFFCDPEAANIVLTETLCPFALVPWETTVEYGIKWDHYDQLIHITTKKGVFFKSITEYAATCGLAKGNKQLFDCDLLAVAAVLYPDCVKASFKHLAAVEYSGTFSKGLTILQREVPENNLGQNEIEIITDFDQTFIMNLIRQMLKS
ncbi:Inosine-uridine preferring nucleoside hydrolase, partial [Stegodyphus mimosarum]